MMFDPPDYPYKELTDNIKDNYDTEDLLFNNVVHNSHDRVDHLNNPIINNDLVTITEQMISNVENALSYQSNDSGRYFNIENTINQVTNPNIIEQNSELFLVQQNSQPDNIFNYEPIMLDDNTVNEFLLPLQNSSVKDKEQTENTGPDLLALHSCVICHEIFTSDADLLDHTILLHASVNLDEQNNPPLLNKDIATTVQSEEINNNTDFESDWLICCLCGRVLSTVLEVEPSEQLCCTDENGKGSVGPRKLHTMYVCDSCNGLFADGEALDRHRQQCCPIQVQDYYVDDMGYSKTDAVTPQWSEVCFSCEMCRVQFPSAEHLKIHNVSCESRLPATRGRRSCTNNTNSNKMWNCGSCNQLFVTARELYRHKRGEDRPPGAPLTAYVCEECDKVLGSMCALHTHKKMHKVSKPGYPCRICGRRFNQSGHLAIHMRMHTGERPYPCDLCPKAFKVKVERDDHRRTHTGERPFACAACPKTFTAAARLREHARIHTDQRPYRCDICGAAFRRPYARTVHTLIHTGEKPHECDVCGTAFRRSGDMWKHKRTLHGVHSSINDGDLRT